jgi:hypothetical protein
MIACYRTLADSGALVIRGYPQGRDFIDDIGGL